MRTRSEAGWRRAIADPERPRERLVCFVTRVERDFSDRAIGIAQPPGGALHAQPPDQLERRLAHHPAKHAMEMERREARAARERLEIERLVQVPGNVLDRALHRVRVERSRIRFHLKTL